VRFILSLGNEGDMAKGSGRSVDGLNLESAPEESAAEADCVVIVTDHAAFDYQALVRNSRLVVDTRNALKGFDSNKIVRL